MDTTTTTVKPVMATTHAAGRLAFAAAAMSLVLLTALHLLSPELDPSWRFVSEYALGQYGWVLALMFLSMAVSCCALVIAIKGQISTRAGAIGLAFLLVAALGMAMAAVFEWGHNLHGVAALIGNPGFLLAALLISLSLVRNRRWASADHRLLWVAALPWISFVLLMATVFIGLGRSGAFGPDVPVGWPNRLLLLTYGVWLMVVAWRAIQIEQTPARTRLG